MAPWNFGLIYASFDHFAKLQLFLGHTPRRSSMRHVILFVLLVGTVGSEQEPATLPWKLTNAQLRAGRPRTGRS